MRRAVTVLVFLFLVSSFVFAQKPASVFCTLDHDLDFKTVKTGDKVSLRVSRDLKSNEAILLPRGTAISATVTDAKDLKSVSLILDKAMLKSGKEVSLMGIIAAITAPKGDLTDDATYSMNHSTEVSQHASQDPSVGVATSGAAAQTAIMKSGGDVRSTLREDSQGAIGIDGLEITWVLDKSPATTVLTSKKKNLKIKGGSEILLRMAPPNIE